jgi:hypothetical protein
VRNVKPERIVIYPIYLDRLRLVGAFIAVPLQKTYLSGLSIKKHFQSYQKQKQVD